MKYEHSSVLGPVARVRQIYALYHATLSYQDMLKMCLQEGINKNTATTQLYACKNKKNQGEQNLEQELKSRMLSVLEFIKSGPDRHTKELWYTEAHSMLSLAAFREVQQ